MTDATARTRHHCPLCDWHLDAPDPDPTPQVTPEWLAVARAKNPEHADDGAFLALLAHLEPIEDAIRTHLETHDLTEWVAEVMRLRENKPPATVYQAGCYDPDQFDQAELFSNRAAAEAYSAQSPGSVLEQVPVLDHAPTRVTVHRYGTYVTPEGVTITPKLPRLQHSKQDRWSHDLYPDAAEWTHPGDHTHIVHPTTEPVVCLLETYGFDQRATWQAHLGEERRLREAVGDA